ncbi:MAG: hypothetical protein F6K50_15935 [Moorea sp. SIO3I7]|nr:hypothetical protein [Moorena sp. SIO3I7]
MIRRVWQPGGRYRDRGLERKVAPTANDQWLSHNPVGILAEHGLDFDNLPKVFEDPYQQILVNGNFLY